MVLKLGIAESPTDPHILDGYQKKAGACDATQFGSEPRNDFIGGGFTFFQGFQRHKDNAGIALRIAGKPGHVINRRIVLDDVDEGFQLFLHGRERNRLVSLNKTNDAAVILLRKKSFWNNFVQIYVHAYCH